MKKTKQRQPDYTMLPQLLPSWYRQHARRLPWRENLDPYRVWVSEIMLQQTRVDTVIPYYERFLQALPDVAHLAAAGEDGLLKLWEGLGYYSRVRNLQKAAKVIVAEYGGLFPTSFETIRRLPGIGDYTAGAIASICFGAPVPAVDGNVLRVLARLTADPRPVTLPAVKKEARAALAAVYPGADDSGDFTQALMELGATVCLPRGAPKCGACPLQAVCQARARQLTGSIPVKEKKKARTIRTLTVFLLTYQDRIAVLRRPNEGLLPGLWELPNVEGHLEEAQVRAQAEAWGADPDSCRRPGSFRHIFTHVEWHMACWQIHCQAALEAPFVLADVRALQQEIALPAAFRKMLPAAWSS